MKLKIIFFPLTLVVAFAIFILMIKPEWESLGANKAQLDTLSEKRDQLQNGKQNLQKAFNEYEDLNESDKQLIINAMPPYKNNDDFIAEIYKNMQGSGAFLVSTDLKEMKERAGGSACEKAAVKAARAAAKSEDPEDKEVFVAAYCPPENITTVTKVEIIGGYVNNIKNFVALMDSQNRLTVPTKTIVERVDNASSEVEVQDSGDLVKGVLNFNFFNRAMDAGIVLSNMADSNDKILDSLLSGSINTQAIDAFKDSITSEPFRPVTVAEWGKEDIFAK